MRCAEEHAVHSIPLKVLQQPTETRFHLAEVEVMPKARLPTRVLLPGLFRIDFPGMEVKERRLLLLLIDTLNRPTG